MSDYSDTNEQLLKAMGFCDEAEIRQALQVSNNDINEAVAILTNEKLPKITTLNNNSMNSTNNSNNDNNNDIEMVPGSPISPKDKDESIYENPLNFPYDCLLSLENNVFTDNWSIPYKKDEWLGRILVSTVALLKEDLVDSEPNCKRFLDYVMPEVYRKLLDTNPVSKWNVEIQTGVYTMTTMALEVIALRLKQEGVPDLLLNTLAIMFTADTAFHNKNMHRSWDKSVYIEKFGSIEQCYSKDLDTHGWLLNLINIFGAHGGFEAIQKQLVQAKDISDFCFLLKPLAACSPYLNNSIIARLYESSLARIYDFIKKLEGEEFKDKNVSKVFDLLIMMKKMCSNFWKFDIENFHKLHLSVVLNMLKYSHYNSKMNSLKEICKLIDNVNSINSYVKINIREDVLSEWIISKKVLSLAVEGNIDQSQYCEKIKTIVEFIGDQIKDEEISALWSMQYNKSMSIIDNLYVIIGIAATKFSPEQLDYLLAQVIQTWNNNQFKLHDKLVGLLRIIGREAKTNKTCSRILEALWELKNRPGLTRQLLLLIYSEHLNVLSGGRLPREAAKREYLKKCCDDIKKAPGSSIAIASLKHMYEILNSYQKNSNKALKDALADLVVPIMKNLCTSLLKCHSNAYEKSKDSNQMFDQSALIDDLFTHEEVVQTHLNSMKFILQEGNLYLNLNRAQDIWNILITNENSCDWDKKTGYEWFIDCYADLNDESRQEIFKKQILTLQPSKLTIRGYECFKLYFIRVNENDGKIQVKNDIDNFVVEKLDLLGMNFLWDIILYVKNETIANLATNFLLEILFEKVSLKLRREIVQLHQKFINECYARLGRCLVTLENSSIGHMLMAAYQISCTSTGMADLACAPTASKPEIMKCIERVLMVAERYIIAAEENQQINRNNLPHFVTFKSEAFPLLITCEHRQPIELYACSNETLGDLRVRVANALSVLSNNVQIYNNDKLLNLFNDNKLLTYLGIDGMSPLSVKLSSSYGSSLNQTPVKDSGILGFNAMRYDPELEKSFPGVLIANGESAFEILYRLEDLDEPKIRSRVRNILKLIPTNPKLLEAYDRIIGKLMNTNATALASTSNTASVAAAGGNANSTANNNNISLVKSPSASSMNTTGTLFNSNNASNNQASFANSSQSQPTTPTFTNSSVITNSLVSPTTAAVAAALNNPMAFQFNDKNKVGDDPQGTYGTSSTKDFSPFFNRGLPLHRVLYHLEALSSKLMPINSEQTSSQMQSTELFQQDFLKANGLEVLINLLQLENYSKDPQLNQYETKQDIYILSLQLLRLIFFGSYFPLTNPALQSTNNCVNKRPSTEPITTNLAKKTITPSMVDLHNSGSANFPSFSLLHSQSMDTTAHSAESTDTNLLSILQKMNVSEVTDIIIQLLTIFWSAAAGNLELAYNKKDVGGLDAGSIRSPRTTSMSSSSNSSVTGTMNKQFNTLMSISTNESPDKSSVIEETASAKKTETTSASETTITEALAAGQKVQKEVKFFIPEKVTACNRLSTGSNMSTSSVESTDNQSSLNHSFSPSSYNTNVGGLQNGICIKQTLITKKDIKIAAKAIEMITCFLQYRKDCISILLNIKMFNECIIDVLTGSISSEIRVYMEKFLLKLSCQIESPSYKCKEHFINLIIKARLPLWINSSLSRASTQKLIIQSTQYFNLRSALLEHMTIEEQSLYSINLNKMLNDEVNWLIYFTPTRNLKDIDNILLTGHLRLTRALLTCETANKADIGSEMIPSLIKTSLFPAAYLINNPSEDTLIEPICSYEPTRLAAYKLLAELSRNCLINFKNISQQLICFHHTQNPSMANEWNYIPLVTQRAECDFVGLKNGGATCYMNAVLQQLFMMPGVPQYLLSIDTEVEKNGVFFQLQNVFAHLKDSRLEYYLPESFWKAFRMWGQEVNIREQQDAFDFFISMTDQIDEYLKKINKEPVFKNIFEGTFSNQFICKDCPHRYEREELFLGLNLPVKSGNLQESMLQFVKDELLDGDNSYNCEQCNEKRSAIKRTCIKKLPKYLCIQLKRFDYDWESNRSLKFDDYFEFPRKLDVAPYMYESINRVRSSNSVSQQEGATDVTMGTAQVESEQDKSTEKKILYDLVGIVVHSGQANAGHYYSFIKGNAMNGNDQEISELEELNRLEEEPIDDIDNNSPRSPTLDTSSFRNDKWYKFNDTTVEEVDFNEQMLIEECFGGTFTQSSEYKMLPEERVRYWNGYMLFYRVADYRGLSAQQNVLKNPSTKLKHVSLNTKSKVTNDSLSELTELVSKGDEKGLFRTFLPPSIEQAVRSENLDFFKNRAIYDPDYFRFIYTLVRCFKDNSFFLSEGKSRENSLFIAECCKLGLEFIFNTFFKTGKKLRGDLYKWLDLFRDLAFSSVEGAETMLKFVVTREATSSFIRHYLLECPILEIREAAGQICEFFLESLIVKYKEQPAENLNIISFITSCVQLLDKAVIDLCKNSHEYFKLLYTYANLSKEASQHLISISLFNKLLCFLLGNPSAKSSEDNTSRRWNTNQAREFAIVHELIALIVLKCNILSMRTCDLPEAKPIQAITDEMTELPSKVSAAKELDFNSENSPQASSSTQLDSILQNNLMSPSYPVAFQPPKNTEDLIQLPQEMQIYLIGALSNRYLKELVFAFEQINHNQLTKTLDMVLTCCYCNEAFSANIIHQILIHVNNSSFNEIKQVLTLLYNIILIEDSLQLKRLRLAIDGYKDSDVVYNGLLSIVRQNQSSDAKKSYQCVKFIVTLANRSGSCKDYLLKTANNWEWSVNWLKTKMLESMGNSSQFNSNWTSSKSSNEDSDIRTFQRTKSAQRTLDDATALLRSNDLDI